MSINSELKKFYYTDLLNDLQEIIGGGKLKIPNYLTKASENIITTKINRTLWAVGTLGVQLTEDEINDFNSAIDELGEVFGGFLKTGVDTLKLEVKE